MASRSLLVVVVLTSAAALGAEPLVGAAVGNADTFVSEATRLYNKKQYPKAQALFLKATRASPATANHYLLLGRAGVLAKDYWNACYAYRTYLKASPDSPDRKKAAAESDQCERKLRAQRKPPVDLTQRFVDGRAAFFASLDGGKLLGPEGAAETLTALVRDGFLGPELGEMATRLGTAAQTEADALHKRAVDGEKLDPPLLRSGRPLYELAHQVSVTPGEARGRSAFLDGLAELGQGEHKKAEAHFTEAMKADTANSEYAFYKGLSLFQAGDRPGALKVLDAHLKDDPRTHVLRVTVALGQTPEGGAEQLEKLLFSRLKAAP